MTLRRDHGLRRLRSHFAFMQTPRSCPASGSKKPHSLSYHEHTFTSAPFDTLVRLASKIDDAGLWLKSHRDERLVRCTRGCP